MLAGPICPMPDRLPGQPRLARGPGGKPIFSGFHALRYYADGTGAACSKCSRTYRFKDKILTCTDA